MWKRDETKSDDWNIGWVAGANEEALHRRIRHPELAELDGFVHALDSSHAFSDPMGSVKYVFFPGPIDRATRSVRRWLKKHVDVVYRRL